MRKVSLYIHIPFCVRKCLYCDFISYEDLSNMDQYISALVKEIQLYSDKNIIIDTVYIGGGTPSLLNESQVTLIVNTIRDSFDCRIEEFTIECNPDSIREDKLHCYRELGINRLSIGVQSLDDNLLKGIGRIHNRKQALIAIELAEKYFDNINIDLMIGLVDESDEIAFNTLDEVIKKTVSHISLYTLILEKATRLYEAVYSNKITLPDEDSVIDRFDYMCNILEKKGFNRYEVSNFAIKGKECKHNIGYWRLKEYIGLGISSSSYIDNIRYKNLDSIDLYIDNINRGLKPVSNKERITIKESEDEYIMLTLRTREGIILDEFKRLYNVDFKKKYKDNITNILDYLNIKDNSISVKPKYFGILHSIILQFLT